MKQKILMITTADIEPNGDDVNLTLNLEEDVRIFIKDNERLTELIDFTSKRETHILS